MAESFFGSDAGVTSGALTPEEVVLCPLCDLEPVEFATDYQGFHLCRCPGCGLQLQSPRLTFEELAEKVYTSDYCPGHEESANDTAFARQLKTFERLIGKKGKVLDVGCGNGAFLEFAKQHGWETFGADIKLSPETAKLTCPLWEGRLPDIDFGGATFDVIRFNHVIEHLQNPLHELARCRQLLNPGGVVFVGVPNVAGVSPRIKNLQSRLGVKKKRWRHYAATHHLYYFTPSTLRATVERAGFDVEFWETPMDKDYGRVGGDVYRRLVERLRLGSILDFYLKPR